MGRKGWFLSGEGGRRVGGGGRSEGEEWMGAGYVRMLLSQHNLRHVGIQ